MSIDFYNIKLMHYIDNCEQNKIKYLDTSINNNFSEIGIYFI